MDIKYVIYKNKKCELKPLTKRTTATGELIPAVANRHIVLFFVDCGVSANTNLYLRDAVSLNTRLGGAGRQVQANSPWVSGPGALAECALGEAVDAVQSGAANCDWSIIYFEYDPS